MHDVTTTGEPFRCLAVKDETTCFCLAIEVKRFLSPQRVIEVLKRLLVLYGSPWYVGGDNGPELIDQPLCTFFKPGDHTESDYLRETVAKWQ